MERTIKGWLAVSDLVVVSNRLPYTWGGVGKVPRRAVSGLVAAVEPVVAALGGTWVGWSGVAVSESQLDGGAASCQLKVPDLTYNLHGVLLSEREIENYYYGLANECLWPLAHGFTDKIAPREDYWQDYCRVNYRFARAVMETRGKIIWVHDYHLSLLPSLLRRYGCNAYISFFWHIPFPAPELWAALPWGEEILQGMLGADLVAFHVPEYVNNFLRAVQFIPGVLVDPEKEEVVYQRRRVRVRALPVGIDWEQLTSEAADEEIQQQVRHLKHQFAGKFLFLSVERLDYTKGVLERLKAVETFFELYPELQDKVVFLQVAVPTRSGMAAYDALRRAVEEAVGRINGRFGYNWQMPFRYQYRALSRRELLVHYQLADAVLVTPLKDGLNLVAKEFAAARVDEQGVLLLSIFAGAAQQLSGYLAVNPYYAEGMARRMREAMEIPPARQRQMMQALRRSVQEYDLRWWWREIITNTLPSLTAQREITPGKQAVRWLAVR